MVGVLLGFAIIGAVIAVGYLVGRLGILGPNAGFTLSRLAFFVLLPALLFTVLAEADLRQVFSQQLPVAAIAAAVNFAAFAVIALAVRRRSVPEATVGALGSGYVNANNIGIPVAAYVLGDASATASVILIQLIVFAPIALTILDLATSGHVSVRRILLQPLRNPLLIASALGLVVALSGWVPPRELLEPFELVGAAGVPVVLLAFGMSLHGSRPLAAGTDRVGVLLAVGLKTLLMPVVAWVLAALVFGLEGHALFVSVALATLPAAQNVFTYAQRYAVATTLARDIVLLSTVLSVPALFVVAALLAA